MNKQEHIYVGRGRVIATSYRSIRYRFTSFGEDLDETPELEEWIPISQMDADYPGDIDEEGDVYVTTWLAQERGWVE